MNKTIIAAISIAVLAVGILSAGTLDIAKQDTTKSTVQIELVEKAYAEGYSGTFGEEMLVSPEFLNGEQGFTIDDLECKVEEGYLEKCTISGEIDSGGAMTALSSIPPPEVMGFVGVIVTEGPNMEEVIALGIINILTTEISENSGISSSGGTLSEVELELEVKLKDLDGDPQVETKFKIEFEFEYKN